MARHTPELVAAANAWRESYNPLRALTIARVATLLEEGEQGRYADLQWLYRFVAKRSATVRALRRLRVGALSRMEWDIRTVSEDKLPKGMDRLADEQRLALRAAYERIDNLRRAITFLAGAEFFGYAHLEKHYADDNPANGIAHLEPVPQWHWARHSSYAPWCYDARAQNSLATPIDPAAFVIREVEDPIMEIAAVAYMRAELGEKDYAGFIETFGIPSIFVIMPPNVPADNVADYQAVADAVISDGRGALPNGSDVKTTDAGQKGEPFGAYLKHQDERIVLAGTGGKLTMLTESGSGTLAGGAHQDTFDQIAAAEGQEISEIFQHQIDAAILAQAFPGRPALAYFQLCHEDREDINALFDRNAKLATTGQRITTEELREKSGYDIEDFRAPGAAAPGATEPGYDPLPVRNRATPEPAPELRRAALRQTATALQQDFLPVAEALGKLLQKLDDNAMTDAQVGEALNAFADIQLPRLLVAMGKDSALDDVTARILGTAAAQGIANGDAP